MTYVPLSTARFPRATDLVRASWCPIYIEPIAGSEERLVAGVAVVNEDGFHVEAANALERLECLYGEQASIVRHAIELLLDGIRSDLAERGAAAVLDFDPVVSGGQAGAVRQTQGRSLAAIASRWMSLTSSLYDHNRARTAGDLSIQLDDSTLVASGELAVSFADRLPRLIYDYVSDRQPALIDAFRADLRGRPKQQRRSYEVTIDFASPALAANFGTLQPGKLAASVRLIKNRLWDLKVDRDRASMYARRYELLVQAPDENDPQFSELQIRNVKEAEQELESQADQEDLRLAVFRRVEDIGERVLGTRQAAA